MKTPVSRLQRSWRSQLLLLLLIAMAVLWSGVAWNHQRSEDEAIARLNRQTSALVLAFAEQTDSTLDRADYVLLQLRQDWLQHNPQAFAQAIERYQSLLADTAIQIAVIDAQGDLAFSNLATATQKVSLADREHFKVHKESQADRLFVSRPVKGRVSGKWSIQLTRPIFDQGRFAGVVVLSVDPGYFVRIYQKIDLGKQGTVSMVRDTGELLARSLDHEKTLGRLINTYPYADAGAPQQGTFRRLSPVDGADRITSYQRFPDYGLSVLVSVSVDEQLAPVRSQRKTVLLIAVWVTLMFLAAGWQLWRSISARERSQLALRASEETFTSAFENAAIGMAVSSLDGRYVRVNQTLCDWLGYDRPALLAKTFQDLTYAQDLDADLVQMRQLVAGEIDVFKMEKRYVRSDGQLVWGWLSVTRINAPDGAPRFLIAQVVDVTQRKKDEFRAAARTSAMTLLARGAPLEPILDELVRGAEAQHPGMLGSVLLLNRARTHLVTGSAHGLPAFFNQAVNGVAIGEAVGSCGTAAHRGKRVIVSDIQTDPLWANYKSLAAQAGLAACWSEPILGESGQVLGTFAFYSRRVHTPDAAELAAIADGAQLAAVAIERKHAQEALEAANQELARSNAELEQFAYVASHDLQEPLRSVSSCVQLLQKRYGGALDARADEFIAHAVGGSQRMQGLIDDLLAYSRVSAAPRVFSATSSQQALDVALSNLGAAVAEGNAQVTHDPLPAVTADPRQLAQLFQNLLGNAIKFRGEQPARVHIGARHEGREWIFSVTDQGIGIDSQYFQRIFRLFQRLHTRDEYSGTGIGLTICQKIVERHGGRIWVESLPGQGTIFYFTLPEPESPDRSFP